MFVNIEKDRKRIKELEKKIKNSSYFDIGKSLIELKEELNSLIKVINEIDNGIVPLAEKANHFNLILIRQNDRNFVLQTVEQFNKFGEKRIHFSIKNTKEDVYKAFDEMYIIDKALREREKSDELVKKGKKFRTVGVDTFDGTSWDGKCFDSLDLAKEYVNEKTKGQKMLKYYVYDIQNNIVYRSGTC